MKFRMTIKILTLFAVALSQSARADFYFHPWSDQSQNAGPFKFNLKQYVLSTNSNFNIAGSADVPSSLSSYSQARTALSIAKNVGYDLTAYVRGTWSIVQVATTSGGASFSGSTFGLADQSVGLAFKLLKFANGGGVTLQGQFDFPGYSNSQLLARNQPFLGDGSTDISGGAFAVIPFLREERASWAVHVGAGFTNRTDGFSSAIPYSLYVQNTRLDPGFTAQVGVYGMQSLGTDTAGTKSLAGTGGSMMSNAVNPSLMNLSANAGYLLNSNFSFNAFFAMGMMGRNAPKFTVFGAGITYVLGETNEAQKLSEYQAPRISTSDATVLKSNDRMNLVKINQGSDDGIKPGMIFTIYAIDVNGKITEAVAHARVTQVKSGESALEITQYIREIIIDEGFIARRKIGGTP